MLLLECWLLHTSSFSSTSSFNVTRKTSDGLKTRVSLVEMLYLLLALLMIP